MKPPKTPAGRWDGGRDVPKEFSEAFRASPPPGLPKIETTASPRPNNYERSLLGAVLTPSGQRGDFPVASNAQRHINQSYDFGNSRAGSRGMKGQLKTML